MDSFYARCKSNINSCGERDGLLGTFDELANLNNIGVGLIGMIMSNF